MRKIIIIALTLVVGASFCQANAEKKDKKKKKAATQMPAVVLNTPSDSISFASGMAVTEGLTNYIKQQYGVEEAFLDDFVRGFEDAVKSNFDDPVKAYSAGIQIAKMVKERMLPDVSSSLATVSDSVQAPLFYQGFIAALKNDTTLISSNDANKLFKGRMEKVAEIKAKKKLEEDAKKAAQAETNRKAGEQFLAENKLREGVKTTPSGLQYIVLTQGNGAIPKADDEVIVKYEGSLIDGTVFDSSYKRTEQTNKFRANQLIKGWTEALTMMPVGSKWKLFIPQELAYGKRDMGEIPPCSTLIFTLELIDIVK